MEPCTMPSFGGKAASQCGCAQTTVPVEVVPVREPSYESVAFAPAPEGVPLVVALIAFAFATFVFARQRRPSTFVQLYLARTRVRPERQPLRLPRLVLAPAERRAIERLMSAARRLVDLARAGRHAPAALARVAAYGRVHLRNR